MGVGHCALYCFFFLRLSFLFFLQVYFLFFFQLLFSVSWFFSFTSLYSIMILQFGRVERYSICPPFFLRFVVFNVYTRFVFLFFLFSGFSFIFIIFISPALHFISYYLRFFSFFFFFPRDHRGIIEVSSRDREIDSSSIFTWEYEKDRENTRACVGWYRRECFPGAIVILRESKPHII